MKTLYLLRHGHTEANGRFVGSTDIPVAESGFKQLEKSRDSLIQKGISKIFCSPKLRCRQSSEFLQLNLNVNLNDDLREIDFGEWEGQSFNEIKQGWPQKVDEWADWSTDLSFPGGENIGDFITRLKAFQAELNTHDDSNILVVAHGGVIRTLICLYLGLHPDKYLLFNVEAGCYSALELYSEGAVLTSLNAGK